MSRKAVVLSIAAKTQNANFRAIYSILFSLQLGHIYAE